jgi:hypothetical protein
MRCNGCSRACENFSKAQQAALPQERICTDCEAAGVGSGAPSHQRHLDAQRPTSITKPQTPQERAAFETASGTTIPKEPLQAPSSGLSTAAARHVQEAEDAHSPPELKNTQHQQQQPPGATHPEDVDVEALEEVFVGKYHAEHEGEGLDLLLKDKNQAYFAQSAVELFGVWYLSDTNEIVLNWRMQRQWDENEQAEDREVDVHDALEITQNGVVLVKDGKFYFERFE